MGVDGAPSSPRDDEISPRDRSPARWEEEEEQPPAAPAAAHAEAAAPLKDEAAAAAMEERSATHEERRELLESGGATPEPYESRGDSRYRHERRRSYDHAAEDEEDRGTTSLLIRHLKFTTAPNVVRSYFETIGPVKDVYLPLEFESGRPRGFGFVEFQHASDAQEALRTLNDTELDGSCISISVAQHGRKTPSLMRARSSGYGRGSRRGGYDRGSRRGEPYSAPDRYERSPPPPKRRYDDRTDDRSRYDRYSSRSRDYDSYYPRDGSPRGGPPSDYDRRRY